MPWKHLKEGDFEFTGSINEWMEDFKRWYQLDTVNNSNFDFGTYLQYITLYYCQFAKTKWEKELLGRRKIVRLEAFIGSDAQGNIKVNVFDSLDFLAENLEPEFRREWSSTCRNEIKQLMKV